MKTIIIALGLGGWLAVGTASSAQPEMSPPDMMNEGQALRGPEVPDHAIRTLVRYTAQGRLVQIEGRPEEAALAFLELEPMVREQARNVVADRANRLAMHLAEQVDTLRESTDAQRAGDGPRARQLQQQLHDNFDDPKVRDPLMAPLREVLGPTDAAELQRLVDEYWDAWETAETRNARRANRDDVRERLRRELFQRELGAAYQRSIRPFQEKLERIYEAVEPTEEQRQAIRMAVVEYIKESRLTPDETQRRVLTERIYNLLSEEQRLRLFETVLVRL